MVFQASAGWLEECTVAAVEFVPTDGAAFHADRIVLVEAIDTEWVATNFALDAGAGTTAGPAWGRQCQGCVDTYQRHALEANHTK